MTLNPDSKQLNVIEKVIYFSKVFWDNTAFLRDGREKKYRFLVLNFVFEDLPT